MWGIYLRGLLEGVLLSRAEVIAAGRALGLAPRTVSDRQIERDLDLLTSELRSAGAEAIGERSL